MEAPIEGELNLYDFPLMALRPSTRQAIVNELNKKKVLASEDGLPRDWRGLAHLTGVSSPLGDSPTAQLLAAWERQPSATLGLLQEYLGQLDRWDILDDVDHLIRDDAKGFSQRMCGQAEDRSPTPTRLCHNTDERILTFDDIVRLENGMELQMYDALLLYADEDLHFARQMVDRLENDYALQLCLKENLVGGLSFEHQGIMRLISERCRRVIIIISRSFINSPVNRFFVTFAQALAIEQRRRIIIPCMYERDHISLPMEINYLHKLDYNRMGLRHYDFWELLRASVTSPPFRSSSHTVSIREVSSSPQEPLCLPQHTAIKPAAQPSKSPLQACSGSLLNVSSQKFTCSSLSLPEKKHKSKSPTEFFRKLFRSDASKQGKKSKKIAVRL